MTVPGIAVNATAAGSLDEAELVPRLRAGDESAREALYRAYRAPLWRFACSCMRPKEVAEELVQDRGAYTRSRCAVDTPRRPGRPLR